MRSLSKLLLTVLLAASPAFAVITCTASWGILTSNGLSPLPPSELLHPAFSKVEVFSDGTYVATYYLIPAGGKWEEWGRTHFSRARSVSITRSEAVKCVPPAVVPP